MPQPPAPGAARLLCLSRRGGEICTRPAGHPGLHHRRHTGLMWSERDADPPRCPGSGAPGRPAARDADGYPGGRGLCAECGAFVDVVAGALAEHDAWRGDATRAEADRRREWFNTHGW